MEAGLMFRDAWHRDTLESLEQIERRTCRLHDYQQVRVVALREGSMMRRGAAAASCTVTGVPWTLMPEPMLSVVQSDGSLCKLGEMISEANNLVQFGWERNDEGTKARILELTQGIQEALLLRTTNESRHDGSNKAAWAAFNTFPFTVW